MFNKYLKYDPLKPLLSLNNKAIEFFINRDLLEKKGGTIKELWTLKWNTDYNIAGPWTTAGFAQPGDWPKWMRHFKDY